jgi:hypothetical protein
MNEHVIHIIDDYLGISWFKEHIVDKSWYYLLLSDKLTHEILQNSILAIKVDHNTSVFTLGEI